MILQSIALVLSLGVLMWGADRFVTGAAALAVHRGVSKLVIGLTVVALGTSAPEMSVALIASFEGNPLLAVGNAIGSNIANIGLVLGVTALVTPLPFSSGVRTEELRWVLAVTILALVLMFDLHLSMLDGLLLIALLGLILWRLYRKQQVVAAELQDGLLFQTEDLPNLDTRQSMIAFGTGLLAILISADMLVWAATGIASWWGVSELVIGLTIVAVGTSLPELAASVVAAFKGHADIAIGNVVGSNILNILTVLTIPALISAPVIEAVVFWRDCGMMLALTLVLTVFAYTMKKAITRVEGAVLLSAWIGYSLFVLS
ncbi:MAG: calcium/sodium antiporter [Gammaproteobacteria bacterium]|nr:calcium/sodium antiporter [Gammaproteobacteria bacterium]